MIHLLSLIPKKSVPPTLSLSDLSDIAQVIIALINIILAIYIFIYQRIQNSKNELHTTELYEQNIKLQWFKEIIIQPNIKHLYIFFENLEKIKDIVNSDNLNEDEIIQMNAYIKDEAKKFRKKFNDVILHVDEEMYKNIKTKIEDLVTKLTTVISDDEYKLTNLKTIEREILEPINYAQNEVVSIVFKYKGK